MSADPHGNGPLPAALAALDVDGHEIYVIAIDGNNECNGNGFITIGLLDCPDDGAKLFRRHDCRELFNVSPQQAVGLARHLLSAAVDMMEREVGDG